MRIQQVLRGTASFAVLSAVIGAAGAAAAQSAPQHDATSVREIVVTAQKREQSLQDVPVVVTALPARLLQNAGVLDIKDMQILTPGLTVTSTSSDAITTARIRGVGTVGDNPGLESSVGVVIDGVYRPRNGVSFGDLGEVERIEVLKGPQGTLFGKNTSAGVINVLTKAPAFTFGAGGELTVGNYNAVGGSAWVTGPITDKLAGRLYVADRKRDGFYSVNDAGGPNTRTNDQDQKYWTVRGQLLFQPDDRSSVRVIADYTRRDEHCCNAVQILTGPTAGIVDAVAPGGQGVANPADPFNRLTYANRPDAQQIIDKGISLEGNFDLGFAKLTNVTSYRDWSVGQGADFDYSGADIVYRSNDGGATTRFKTFTEELRLAGKTDRVDWLIGGFYAHEDLTSGQSFSFGNAYNPYVSLLLTAGTPLFGPNNIPCFTGTFVAGVPQCNGPVFPVGKATQDYYSQVDKTFALFTNETVHLTDKMELNLGLRYTKDDKSLASTYSNLGTNGAACGGALTNYANGNLTGLAGPAGAQAIFAVLCLPWGNPFFAGRSTNQAKSETNTSGTAKLLYHFTPDLMGYASYARGYKAGGFNEDRVVSTNGTPSQGFGPFPVTDTSFAAETVNSYELGLKSTLLDGKLLLNGTVFDQQYHHFQLNQFTGLVFIVDSIPQVTSKGIDLDFLYFTPISGLTLQGGVTRADTRFNRFAAGDLTTPANFGALSLLPGSRLSFAPLYSVSGAVTYDHQISDNLRVLANVDAKYSSSYNTGSDLDPNKMQSAYTMVNARVGIGAANRRWAVELWATNLTNVNYRQVVFDAPLQGQAALDPSSAANRATQTYDAFLGQPRTVGITLRVRY